MDIDLQAFWTKLSSVKGDSCIVVKALTLFYVLCDGDSPTWVKAVCTGALVYFINPWDPVGPDPLIFADDIAVMASALSSLSSQVKDCHKAQAKCQ